MASASNRYRAYPPQVEVSESGYGGPVQLPVMGTPRGLQDLLKESVSQVQYHNCASFNLGPSAANTRHRLSRGIGRE